MYQISAIGCKSQQLSLLNKTLLKKVLHTHFLDYGKKPLTLKQVSEGDSADA